MISHLRKLKFFLTIIGTLLSSVLFAQNITTIVGGTIGDGRIGTSIGLGTTPAVQIDSNENIYFLDQTNARIRKLNSATGIVTTVAGGGPQTISNGVSALNAGFFVNPNDPLFCIDKSNNIYIPQPTKIYKMDAGTGIINSIIGTGTRASTGDGGLAVNAGIGGRLYSIYADANGNIYFADSFRIRKISATTGIVNTIVGTGVPGYSGDGGPATQAKISQCISIVVDRVGNLFFYDRNNYVIRRVDAATGVITTYAGTGVSGNTGDGGLATAAQFSTTGYLAIDAQGNLYISGNNRIRKITGSTGLISAYAGTGSNSVYGENIPAISCGFNAPMQISIAPSGHLYVPDALNFTIRKIDINTTYITTVCGNRLYATSGIGGGPLSLVQIIDPSSVAVDKSGNIYFPDYTNDKIYRINTSQQILVVAGTGVNNPNQGNGGLATSAQLATPAGIIVDSSGNFYFIDAGKYIRKVTYPSGIITLVAGTSAFGYGGDGGPALSAIFNGATSLAIDTAGNIYIADRNNNRIRKITASTGVITTVAGNGASGYTGDGGPATSASLSFPSAVAVDRWGNIYISDVNNYVIRRVDAATNIITTFAGTHTPGYSGDGGPATAANIYWCEGLAIDKAGNVYISDLQRSRIRKVTIATGIISTVAGNGSFVYNGDDIPAAIASLEGPEGITFDKAGNLFIADRLRIRKVNSAGLIHGNVFYDYNSNGAQDAGEPYADGIIVNISSASYNLSTTTKQGRFKEEVDTGTYVTKAIAPRYYSIAPLSKTSILTQANDVDSFAFALQPISNINDLSISITSTNSTRVNSLVNYSVMYKNEGTSTINNAFVKFVKDPRTSITSSFPVASSVVNDSLYWNLGTVSPRTVGSINITLKTEVPPVLNIGDYIHHLATISPVAGDSTPRNDTSRFTQLISGSYDPNEKIELHAGSIAPTQLANGEYLYYTIHFQNTGNDTAFVVIIRDTLSSKYDLSSLELISSSHPFDFSIKNGNQLSWVNQNILLPDSNVNKNASQGYVSYMIKLKPNIVAGDSVQNRAAIYFDYNTPVVTNWSTTLIKNSPAFPPQPAVNFISSAYCKTVPEQKIKIANLPTASGDTKSQARVDLTPLSIGGDSAFSIYPQQMQAGTYSVVVEFNNQTGYVRSVYPITIVPPGTPDVDISASSTQITSTSDQVTVTATNKAAGGNTPKYSFATDRNFVNVLQAESTSPSIIVTATQLTDGDNWIYVRMKSSDTCVTTSTAIDSIKILKNVNVTGIIDVDNPSVIINTYPNPINKKISITGLLPTKNYMVVVTDNLGNRIIQRSSRGVSSLTIYSDAWRSGPYWISIYDKNKNKLIGSMRIVKQ